MYGLQGAGGILALFVLIVPFEKMFKRHPYKTRRPGLRTDLTYALVGPLINFAGLVAGIIIAILAFPIWLPALALRPLVTAQPGWLMIVEAVVFSDILIYWTHRLSHEVGFFWRFHSIHHTSEWKSPGLTDTDSEATVVVSGRKSRCHVHIHLSSVYARLSWPG